MTVTVVFNNADATPKTEVVHVDPDSVPTIMTWYSSHFKGDLYTVTVNGRNVKMDEWGEPLNYDPKP